MTVTVVDDDEDLLEFLRALLAARHEVRVFATGRSAVEALRDGLSDVVLSDLGLLDLPGEEVARMAARLDPRPWVVLMSGDPRRLQRARPLADATLLKPFSIKDLVSACETERETR